MTATLPSLSALFRPLLSPTARLTALVLLVVFCQAAAFAQAPPAPVPAAGAPKPAEEPTGPQPIPLSDIAPQAEVALSEVRQLENRSRITDAIHTATAQLPPLERETAYRFREARRLDGNTFPLESIQGLEEELRDIEARMLPVRRDLTRSASQIDRDLKELERLQATWTATITAASEANAPREVLQRAKDINEAIAQAKKDVLDDRAKVLALQGRTTDIGTRLADIRRLLAVASERAVTRLLYRDGPPLWSGAFWAASIRIFSGEATENLVNQAATLADYLRSRTNGVVLHVLFFIGLVIVLSAARTKVDALCRSDEGLRSSKRVFDMPVVTAMLLSMLVSTWFYPRPPRALWLVISVLAAAPLLVFARRVCDPLVYPPLYWMVIFYLVDRARALFAPLPGVHRVMLLLEALGLMLFILTSLRRQRQGAAGTPQDQRLAWVVIRYAGWSLLVLAAAVVAFNAAGYARLADLLMRAVLSSAYAAAVLYALSRAGEGMVHGLLYLPPLTFLAGVRRHRAYIAARIGKWMKWAAFVYWVVLTLEAPGFLQQAIGWLQAIWNASIDIGDLNVAVSEVSLFVLILWTTWVISRLSRFFLEEEIFSRVRLDRGLPYAVSTTLHYAILLSGFVLALTAIGVDMTKFTIVAGALTVGIGFGLQNIVNNFVSGLIVLFERPVRVGDTIQIDDIVGRVQHIGIRATVIHSTSGAEVIIPNGKLISDKVTNWTLSSQLRQISVPVITRSDIDVAQLKPTLVDVARRNKRVLETPEPEVLFIKRGVDTFEFELRAWTSEFDAWLAVKSDLTTEINEALRSKELPAQAAPAAPLREAGQS